MLNAQKRAQDLRAQFETQGASVVETPVLQSAETLLDLYGEDIRARAYVTDDALLGERMLRPDFTVPVVQMHMNGGAEPARYTYCGAVFRRQDSHPERPNEYLQVGYEIFDRSNPAAADAEVFSLTAKALAHLDVQPITGDIGLLMAAIEGLNTTARRKAALMRHVWRPKRFRALLDRFSGRTPVPAARMALLQAADPLAQIETTTGKRSLSAVRARIKALKEDAQTAPISAGEMDLLEALLEVRETLPFALERLRDLAVDMPAIEAAVEGVKRRTDALAQAGTEVESLPFDTTYGRSSMEYYDGFVFAFFVNNRADLPAIASGGRYDALTRRLGNGAEIPAVGAVLRPDLIADLEADT